MTTDAAQGPTKVGTELDLPEGWTLTTIGQACELNPPKPGKDALPPSAPVTFVPMPAVDAELGAVTTPSVRPFSEVRSGYTAFRDGDVIMAKITPCMENGKAAILRDMTNGLGFGSTEFHVLRPNGAALAEYLFYFIRQQAFRTAAETEMTGSVGQRRVPADFLSNSPILLPPVAEQRLIVAAVDALLTRINGSRERLQRVPMIMKRFRQSVLAAACSGRLTEDWRASHSEPAVSPEEDGVPPGWKLSSAGEFFSDARYGTSMKCDYLTSGGVPVLRMPNILKGRVDLGDLKYAHSADGELAALMLQEGDIVVCRTNGSLDLIGKAAVVPRLPVQHAFASYLIRLRLDSRRLLPSYLHLCLSSELGRQHIEERARTTAGQFNLNLAILREFEIPVPPLLEQERIAQRVDQLFALADAIDDRVRGGTVAAEKLAQAALAKAFRGELVPAEAEIARQAVSER